MIVVDTNVWSELMRPEPDLSVRSWARRRASELYLPSVALGELRFGVARLAAGRKKGALEASIDQVAVRFAARILSFDADATRDYAPLLAAAREAGRPMSTPDAQIAAIAKAAMAPLATRNVRDFASTGLTLINPWDAP
ncbi:MAG: type II toxin-antitoxin system VapC family toxin [Pseudomonadota bacterium]